MKAAILEIPDIPNTYNFWHGGNLDEYKENLAQRTGHYEYGSGLYLITHYDTAQKYAKGNRKLYLVTVAKGNDIRDAVLPTQDAIAFIKDYAVASKRKELIQSVQSYDANGTIKAYLFNNMLLNHKAIKATRSKELRSFLVNHHIDYEIVHNPFGWNGEIMMVLYNMRKIAQVKQVKPTDKVTQFNLRSEEEMKAKLIKSSVLKAIMKSATDEYVLWGTKKGEPKWKEQLITSTKDKQKLKDATAWAKKNGFVNLRVSGLDLSTPPDFVKALKLKAAKEPGDIEKIQKKAAEFPSGKAYVSVDSGLGEYGFINAHGVCKVDNHGIEVKLAGKDFIMFNFDFMSDIILTVAGFKFTYDKRLRAYFRFNK